MTLADKLMLYRQQTGYPQTLLADWMGVSVPTYKRTETGGRQATQAELTAFSSRSGLPLSMLSRDEESLPTPLPPVPAAPVLIPRGRPLKAEPVKPNSPVHSRLHQYIATEHEGNQRKVAERLQMDESLLSRYLSGKREITDKFILRFARVFGISADWLRAGIGTPTARLIPVVEECHDGKKLANYLGKHGLDWMALHQATGNNSYTSTLRYGQRGTIRHETRQKIAEALQVSVRDIFGC